MKILLISFAIIAACSAAVLSPDQPIPVVRQVQDIHPDGSYSYSYETGNGIAAEEVGEGGHFARGSAQWHSPEGTPVHFTYVADENGYQPQGDLLPVAPAIPEAILRSLAWISAHPPKEEGLKRFKRQPPPPGSDPCTWGPAHWCKNKENAEKCGATQHCEERVWENGKPPAE